MNNSKHRPVAYKAGSPKVDTTVQEEIHQTVALIPSRLTDEINPSVPRHSIANSHADQGTPYFVSILL